MKDVQNEPANIFIPIDNVGIKNVKLPLVVAGKTGNTQATVAVAELGVNLPKDYKGTHMSRLVQSLESWDENLSYQSVKTFLEGVKERLNAQKSQVSFVFPFFIRKKAPVSGCSALQAYDCKVTGILENNNVDFSLGITVPVMTVCPCSKAISREGAHSQRSDVRISVVLKDFTWLEDFIEIAENSGSSPIYPVLKREDEKYVTETAFATPRFVEDVVRNAAQQLQKHTHISSFLVEVESYESIHGHNAYAKIEQQL